MNSFRILFQKRIYIFFICIAVFIFVLSLLSKGTYGGSDDYVHYRFARYAFKYPYFLLDHWAKPLFTLLAAPFAQFGYFGIKIFNLIAGLTAGWFTYQTSKKLGLKQSWIAFVFVLFAPVYLSLVLSGMTEILFSCVLIATVFFTIDKKYVIAALILSFLPFVRTEGIIIIPFFALYFLLNKKLAIIPLLLTGTVIYSVVGWLYYGDYLWLINKLPYTGAKDIYGSGSLLHFVNSSKSVFGIPMVLFIIIGIHALITIKFRKTTLSFKDIFILIFLPFIAFIIFHSVLWWLGKGGSLGLTRVLASIVPLAAILATIGIDYIAEYIRKQWILNIILALVLYLVISTPFQIYKFPVPLSNTEKLIRKAADWTSKNGLDKQRIYYYSPYYCHYKGIDPYNKNLAWEQLPNRETPSKDVMIGSIAIWDSQFGPNEGRLPVEKILSDSLMQLLKVFRPIEPFQVLNGYNYEICIFKRIDKPINTIENFTRYNENANPVEEIQTLRLLDFEKDEPAIKDFKLTDSVAYTGIKSCIINNGQEFGPTIILNPPVNKTSGNQVIESEVYFYNTNRINPENIILAASIEHGKKLYFYKAQQGIRSDTDNSWIKISLKFIMPEIKSKNDLFKFYIWNKDMQNIVIDNFSVSIGQVK